MYWTIIIDVVYHECNAASVGDTRGGKSKVNAGGTVKKNRGPKIKVNATDPVTESKPTIALAVKNALFVKNIRGVLGGSFQLTKHDWKMVDFKPSDVFFPDTNTFRTTPNRDKEFSDLRTKMDLFELTLTDETKHILKPYTEKDSECMTACIKIQVAKDHLSTVAPGRTI